MQSTNTFEMARYGADLQRRIHDMPIGDPMAGAPYGEYLKSKGLGMIIGIVASVVTMGAAAPLLASTVLATQIAGGVMMAGGVLSGVGAVTGNKKLSKIGGIMSLAGGIGAVGANLAGAGSQGATGALASGSGSEAVSTMSNSFMDSASNVSGGLAYGERVAGEAAAQSAGDFAANAATSEGGAAASGAIEPSNISNTPPVAGAEEMPAETLKLADTPANTGSTNVGYGLGTDVPATATTPATGAGVTSPPVEEGGLLNKASKFLTDNKELMKVGANTLEMGIKYGMGGDAADAQMAEALNRAKVYDAQASLLGTQNAQAQFQLANQNKKSVMLSADDPQLEQKLAAAKAEGAAIGIIPAIGGGGVKPVAGAQFGNSAAMPAAGQQVVRQPTYTQPGIINKAA